MTAAQSSVIAAWLEQLDRIEAEARHLSDSLSEAQFAWRPGSGRWSAGECLDHLAITTGLTLGSIRPALERGRVEGITGAPPFKYGVLGGWFVRAMEKPGKRRMFAPPNFVPPSGVPKPQVMAASSPLSRSCATASPRRKGSPWTASRRPHPPGMPDGSGSISRPGSPRRWPTSGATWRRPGR